MSSYKIGRVIGVSGDQISISLIDYLGDSDQSGVPETMAINVNTKLGPQPLLIGQPSSFIKISLPIGQLLCIVTGIQMKEDNLSISDLKQAGKDGQYPIQSPKRILSAVPIGTIAPSGDFEIGTDILPTINSDAFAVLNETIDHISHIPHFGLATLEYSIHNYPKYF